MKPPPLGSRSGVRFGPVGLLLTVLLLCAAVARADAVFPSTPQPLSPAATAVVDTIAPTLRATLSEPGCACDIGYEFTVFDGPDPNTANVVDQRDVGIVREGDVATLVNVQSGRTYWWIVEAYVVWGPGDVEYSDYSTPRSFQVALPAWTISVLGPSGNLTVPPAAISWYPIPADVFGGNVTYTASVSLNADGSAPFWATSVQHTTTMPLPAAQFVNGRSYFWRLDAWDGSVTSTGGLKSFTMKMSPSVPALNTPAAGAAVRTLTPTLTAPSTPDSPVAPLRYWFQVATDTGFTQGLRESAAWQTSPAFAVPAGWLRDKRTYYWRAKAQNAFGTSEFSAARSFATDLVPLGRQESWPMFSRGPVAVNQATGNLVLEVPGPSYPAAVGSMSFTATYNSHDTRDQGLGAGFELGVGGGAGGVPARLLDHTRLAGAEGFDAVEVVFPDGESEWYVPTGTGTSYRTPDGGGAVLQREPAGFTLTDPSGDVLRFGAANPQSGVAPLVQAETIAGEPGKGALAYTFDTTGPSPRLVRIQDPAGRRLTLRWASLEPAGCVAAIVCVEGPDGVVWRYVGEAGGGTGGRLVRVSNGTRDVLALAWNGSGRPSSVRNANDLNPAGASPGYNGAHQISLAYDTQARPRLSRLDEGPVSGQTPATSTWSFEYLPGDVAIAPTRAAHPGLPLGSVRTAAGLTRMVPPRQQGRPTPKKEIVHHDDEARVLQRTDLLGNVTQHGWTPWGAPAWSEDELGHPTDLTYEPVEKALLTETAPDPDGAGALGRPLTTFRYDERAMGTAAQEGPALEGLQAAYFANPNLAGRPAAVRTDGAVDFDWGAGGPPALGGQTDGFSARWSGRLLVAQAGTYVFTAGSDDGTRLVIDGSAVIDRWVVGAYQEKASQAIHLSAGAHRIELHYFENASPGPARVRLLWRPATAPQSADAVIPASALRPAYLNRTSRVSPTGLVAFTHYAEPQRGISDYQLQRAGGQDLITSLRHDAFGRLVEKVMPRGNATRTIDAQGELQGPPAPGFATAWTYYATPTGGPAEAAARPAACGGGAPVNQGGLLKSTGTSGLATVTHFYDPAGRAVADARGRGTTCRTYSAEGRLTGDQAPGEASATSYAYDPAGALRTASGPTGTVSRAYDEAGRVTRTLDSQDSEATSGYDAEGNRTQQVTARGTIAAGPTYTTQMAYDEEGRLTQLTDPAGRTYRAWWDARGKSQALQYPNGTFRWSAYNAAGWLTQRLNRHGTLPATLPASAPADASPIADYAYAYDLEGRTTQETLTAAGQAAQTRAYAYDGAGRLSTYTMPSGTQRRFEYDRDGNRTRIAETPSGGAEQTKATYLYEPAQAPGVDQLSRVTYQSGEVRTFTYTADGDLASEQTPYNPIRSLTWDGRGRMSGAEVSANPVTYVRDPLGRVRSRSASGNLTTYLLADGEAPHLEVGPGGQISGAWVAGPEGAMARFSSEPTQYVHPRYLYYNGHGDLAAEAANTGARTLGPLTYDPFGAPDQSPGGEMVERYVGKWQKKYDVTTRLVLMGARPYDPVLGRFLAVDPVAGGSLNHYDYANQDPVNTYDLDGRIAWRKMARAAMGLTPAGQILKRAGQWVDRKAGGRVTSVGAKLGGVGLAAGAGSCGIAVVALAKDSSNPSRVAAFYVACGVAALPFLNG